MVQKDNKIFAIYKYNGERIEILLHDKNFQHQYKGMNISNCSFDITNDSIGTYIRIFYIDRKGEIVSPPTFLNLFFKKTNNDWKVISLEFQV